MLARFEIVAREDPQLLMRMLNHFAMRGLTPARATLNNSEGFMVMQIDQPNLSEQEALIIAEKMRVTFLVEDVRLLCEFDNFIRSKEQIDDIST